MLKTAWLVQASLFPLVRLFMPEVEKQSQGRGKYYIHDVTLTKWGKHVKSWRFSDA